MQLTKLTSEDLQIISTFEKITRSKVEDYTNDGSVLYFVVTSENFRNVIGKEGSNIRRLETGFGKKVKVFRYSKDLKDFVKNLTLQHATHVEVDTDNGTVEITVPSDKKALLIGRDGKNINAIKAILARHFDIKKVTIK